MSEASDFDFLIGAWRVSHRRLRERLAGCEQWEEFTGSSRVRWILGGQGNTDENWIDLPGGAYRAATLRCFDPAKRCWTIWWLDARHPGAIAPPLSGAFVNGEGRFFADDVLRNSPIRVRFIWRPGDSPRWEQAFSGDDGVSWETNWTMDFARAETVEV